MDQEKTLCLSQSDTKLPLWFALLLGKNGRGSLTLLLEEERIVMEEPVPGMEVIYLENRKKRTGVAILCTILSEDMTSADLLTVGNEPLLQIPEGLDFMHQPVRDLDVCFSLIAFFEHAGCYAEQFVICYQKPITVIPDFLTLDQARLQILRQDVMYSCRLSGLFSLDGLKEEGKSIAVTMDITSDSIQAALGDGEGELPTLLEFLDWMLKKTGGSREELLGWLSESKKTFDVGLEEASLTLETEEWTVEDYQLKFRLFLWGLRLDVSFLGRDKVLVAALGEKISLRRLWNQVAGGAVLPEELEAMEISKASVRIFLEGKLCVFQCSVEEICKVAGFELKDISIQLTTGEKQKIEVRGKAVVGEDWEVGMTVIYQDARNYEISGELRLIKSLDLGEIPLVSEFFPDQLEWKDDGISLVYEKGRLTEGRASFSYSEPKKERPELVTTPRMEQLPDGKIALKEEAVVPEQGAIRQGDEIRWMEVRKKLGGLRVERVGMLFEGQTLWAALEAGMSMSPVEIDVLGLMAGYDLKNQRICFKLNGLALSCNTAAFALSGVIGRDLELPEHVRESYSGALLVKFSKLELSAKGSYAVMDDRTTSLFVFLNCSMMLAVLPALQITQIMGGMGINRKLRIPKAEEVKDFPLLSDGKNEAAAVKALNHWIVPAKGEYWAAAGLHFQACGLLRGKVLLALLMGEEFQAALVGSADVVLPKGASREKAYAHIEIFLSALLRPQKGTFLAEAVLSRDSFLLDHNCHVFGKAACAIWFGSHEKAGDFVLTVGGYHPSYRPPSHYPRVERVGFSWQMSRELSAKGEVYLAVTPSCIMAGGSLELLFVLGNLKAWFTAYVDLLLNWHPFFFDGQVGVELGVSYRMNLLFCHKTIKITLGGDLHIWGPPMGGKLKVRLAFIRFTISFGKSQEAGKKALSWKEMRESVLPGESLHSMEAAEGIRPQNEEDTQKKGKSGSGVLISDRGRFELHCKTAVPEGTIRIRPMRLSGVQSSWKISVTSPEGKTASPETFGMTVEKKENQLPEALWGEVQERLSVPGEGLVPGVTECVIHTKPLRFHGTIEIPDYKESLVRCLTLPNPLAEIAETGSAEIYGEEETDTIERLAEIGTIAAYERRMEIAGCLREYYGGEAGAFEQTQTHREHLYADCPRYRSGS